MASVFDTVELGAHTLFSLQKLKEHLSPGNQDPFPWTKLPTEIKFQILRLTELNGEHAAHASQPRRVLIYEPKLHLQYLDRSPRDGRITIPLGLLLVNKALNTLSSDVLYKTNTFRYYHSIPPSRHIAHIRHLEMVLAMQDTVWVNRVQRENLTALLLWLKREGHPRLQLHIVMHGSLWPSSLNTVQEDCQHVRGLLSEARTIVPSTKVSLLYEFVALTVDSTSGPPWVGVVGTFRGPLAGRPVRFRHLLVEGQMREEDREKQENERFRSFEKEVLQLYMHQLCAGHPRAASLWYRQNTFSDVSIAYNHSSTSK